MKMDFFRNIISDEAGATAIEYGLIAALIAVVLIGALGSLGGSLTDIFTGIEGKLDAAVAVEE